MCPAGTELLLRGGVGPGPAGGARGHPEPPGAGAGPQGPGLHRLPGAAARGRGTAAGPADHTGAAGLCSGKRWGTGLVCAWWVWSLGGGFVCLKAAPALRCLRACYSQECLGSSAL